MRTRTVVKLGTILSVVLFGIAVGFYAFTQLDRTTHNRHVNLFTLVPSHCISVLETDDAYGFLTEILMQNYGHELKQVNVVRQFDFILQGLNEYASRNAHGLSSQMNRMLISFHDSLSTIHDRVVYIGLGSADKRLLEDILHDCAPSGFIPKEEKYRGKQLLVYPLGGDVYLTSYLDEDFMVLSLQKRLIEQVVDAKLDKQSLNDDDAFGEILQKKKSKHNLTLYVRTSELPFLNTDVSCWSEYDFHLNSDVFYLTGETYLFDMTEVTWKNIGPNNTFYEAENIFMTTEKDTMAYYIDRMYENDTINHSLFTQCMANLSKDASFTFVADMQKMNAESYGIINCFPSVVGQHFSLLESFILSMQYFYVGNKLSHIWVFTYKN